MPFQFTPMPVLPEVILVEPKSFGDDRGWFMETYKKSDFQKAGIPTEWAQDNQSWSARKHTIRGLHYQTEPHEQGKLIRIVSGALLDVVVDIRRGSPTFLKFVTVELSAQNKRLLYIPAGFAHGMCTLTDDVNLVYKVTKEYSHPHDRSIRWDDPTIGITWPTQTPTLSKKDAEAPYLKDAEINFTWKAKP